jgi:hypothetical protein
VNWDVLLEYASNLRDGTKCTEYSWGHNHLVRLIKFGNKKRLLASLHANDTGIDWDAAKMSTEREATINAIIRGHASVPVPEVYA